MKHEIENKDLIGGAWLARQYGIVLGAALPAVSSITKRRTTRESEGRRFETFLEALRPEASLRGHVTFHLKHEVPHLELLARLFERIDPQDLAAWVEGEPTGQYARRAGFLYEWLTGRELPIRIEPAGPLVDALNPGKLVTATPGLEVPNRRWRVRDNMPGTRHFCPMVRKTPQLDQAMALDIPALLHELEEEFGDQLLMRAAVWMTLRESRSSFKIEGEADKADRIQRFADVIARRTGVGPLPLDHDTLALMQSEILGRRTILKAFGIRQSPVFVGEVLRYEEVVHYVAPPVEDLQPMLDGIKTFLARTQGQSGVMRSAVAAFGFVYIHPMADGNGRVHRFLINDILRRDGLVKEPMIIPVSSLISNDSAERRAYDRVLDTVSSPLMHMARERYHFAAERTPYPDGVISNFVFQGDDLVRPAWRLPDLSAHVMYLAHLLAHTIQHDMREESRYMQAHGRARLAIKEVVEMPDVLADRVIRSIEANGAQLSGALSKEIPYLLNDGVWDEICEAVGKAFENAPPRSEVSGFRPRQG